MLPLNPEPQAAGAVLALPSTLTQHQARSVLQSLLVALHAQHSQPIVLQAADLQVFDSSALAVLLECRRQALSAQKIFTVRGLPPALQRMAELYGVAPLLTSSPE